MRRFAFASFALVATVASAADPQHPTVVELFTSQGCSSCPPADAALNRLATRADLLPLAFSVTYWDRLGWKDRFGRPAYTQRQIDYARAGRGQTATPEMIINGRAVLLGGDTHALPALLARADRGMQGPSLTPAHGSITIGGGRGSAIVWLVRYDPRAQRVPIGAGENGGRTLVQRNVVRGLARLGTWRGQGRRFAVPTAPAPLAQAVLVQAGTGGPIVAAARL